MVKKHDLNGDNIIDRLVDDANDYKYVTGDIKQALSDLITDMWLNDFPSKAESTEAYQLYRYFNLGS